MDPLHDKPQSSGADTNPVTRRPLIIPVFIPHAGCPHQCAFCNQTTITGTEPSIPTPRDIDELIHRLLEYGRPHRSIVQLAFYGGNFLGLPEAQIISLLEHAARSVASGTIGGIRFSTRPDTITLEQLSIIDGYPVQTVELGVQSMDDHVLSLSRRGHSATDTANAVELLKKRGYEIGLQMMVGLPGEDEGSCLSSGQIIAGLSPDFVRIYPTVVLKESLLARWYREGAYEPLPLEEAVRRATKLYKIFEDKDIPVIRIGLQPTAELEKEDSILAGPYHPSFGELVYSEVFYEKASTLIQAFKPTLDTICLKVHPKSVSKLKGQNNHNINKLKEFHQLRSIQVVPDPSLSINEIDILAPSD